MSIFISLLINFLASFLIKLLEQWLSDYGFYPTPTILVAHRSAFLNEVKWRFWLGFGRIARAEKAFDLAVTNYSNLPKTALDSKVMTANTLVSMSTNDIATQL